ncbi:MAG: hypothetical protein ACRD5Z_15370 [Bryobacteraceae bacterium]
MTPQAEDRALPVGRILRFVIGFALIAEVIPVYGRVDARFLSGAALLVVGLLVGCSLVHVFVSRHLILISPWLGAALANALLVAVFVGGYAGWLLRRGEGQVATITFLGASLLLAALRGDAGCEVMSIPSALFGGHSRLPCIVFSSLDWLEGKLRGRASGSGPK